MYWILELMKSTRYFETKLYENKLVIIYTREKIKGGLFTTKRKQFYTEYLEEQY